MGGWKERHGEVVTRASIEQAEIVGLAIGTSDP
jgi:hypothetical protein